MGGLPPAARWPNGTVAGEQAAGGWRLTDRPAMSVARSHCSERAFLTAPPGACAATPVRLSSNSMTGPAKSTCISSNVRHSQPMGGSTWLAAFCTLLLKVWWSV